MIVTARYHRSSHAELKAWVTAVAGIDPERRRTAKANLEAYRLHLIRTLGEPKGSVDAHVWPRTMLWEFEKGWWFACTIRDQKSWFHSTRREVLIVRCVRSDWPPSFP